MDHKEVPLFVENNTDGTDKTEIGTAKVYDIPNGDKIVDLKITNPRIAELLGGTEMKGIIPKTPLIGWEDAPHG